MDKAQFRVEGRSNHVKKSMWFQKYPDSCGRGLKQTIAMTVINWSNEYSIIL